MRGIHAPLAQAKLTDRALGIRSQPLLWREKKWVESQMQHASQLQHWIQPNPPPHAMNNTCNYLQPRHQASARCLISPGRYTLCEIDVNKAGYGVLLQQKTPASTHWKKKKMGVERLHIPIQSNPIQSNQRGRMYTIGS